MTTRVILPMINEAMQVVLEGVATAEDVDTAMKLGYNMDIGPLALADRMGLDEVLKWMEHLFRELGDLKYRPCPILRMKVRAGHLWSRPERDSSSTSHWPEEATEAQRTASAQSGA